MKAAKSFNLTLFVAIAPMLLLVSCGEKKLRETKPKPRSLMDGLSITWEKRSGWLTSEPVINLECTARNVDNIKLKFEDQSTLNTDVHHAANNSKGMYTDIRTFEFGSLFKGERMQFGKKETGWTIKADTVVTISANGYGSRSLYFFNDDSGKLVMTHGYAEKKATQVGEWVHKLLK